MLTSSSRYTTTTSAKDNQSIVIGVRKPISKAVEYVTYTARDGESFVTIATRLYNDPTQYWRIADINPQIAFPDRLSGGTTVRVPK